MREPIIFPEDDRFIEDLILQRTGDFVKYGGRPALDHWFASGDRSQLVDCLRTQGLVQSFLHDTAERLRLEAQELIARLPMARGRSAVSIGPGNGLIELFLFDHLQFSKLLLIDIEDSERHVHGFAEQGAGYASLSATREFLVANGVPEDRLLTCNPTREPLPDTRFDLLISLLSMGFHFPCDDYADFILNNAEAGARIVMDKRMRARDPGYDRLLSGLQTECRVPSMKSERLFMVRQR